MYSTTERVPKVLKVAVTLAFTAALATAPLALAQEKAETKEVTGEIVDMMCYIDHNAMGDKHAACGEKCIKGGAPVGIVSDGKAMIVVGAHKPMNDELAPLAGKTVTLKGKVVSNGGVSMLENAEIVKK
jgi:hypothetical protein